MHTATSIPRLPCKERNYRSIHTYMYIRSGNWLNHLASTEYTLPNSLLGRQGTNADLEVKNATFS